MRQREHKPALVIGGILLICSALVFVLPVFARTGKDYAESELQEVREAMKRERESLSRIMDKRGDVLGKMAALKKQMKRSEERLSDLEAEKRVLSAETSELSASISEMAELTRQKKHYMGRRMAARYKFSNQGTLRVWLEAESVTDFVRRMKYLDVLFEADKRRIDDYRNLMAEWERAKEGLEKKKRSVAAMEDVIVEQKSQLDQERESLRSMLRKINSEKSSHQAVLKELEESEKELTRLLEALEKDESGVYYGFAKRKGALCYPASGPVKSDFGKKVHPEFNTVTMQKGIEIGSRRGDSVRTVLGGVVRFAQWFRGYGNMVIVDHGDSYYTVYGHMSSFTVSIGDKIERGDTLGTVGDTGSLSGPSLYFEIRHKQTPLDPADWLADCVER